MLQRACIHTCIPFVSITLQGDVKLHNYGLYYMTDCGKVVKFPIGYIYMYIYTQCNRVPQADRLIEEGVV